MNNENSQVQVETTASPSALSRRAAIQRGLRKGGMVAAPVLMTTMGRAAMGTQTKAKMPSGFQSINNSRPGNLTTNGCTPAEWITKINSAGAGGVCNGKVKSTTLFSALLTGSSSDTDGKTVIEVLNGAGAATGAGSGGTALKVAGYVLTTLLNYKDGRVSNAIKDTDPQAMWTGYLAGGYKPAPVSAPTLYWGGPKIVEYIAYNLIG